MHTLYSILPALLHLPCALEAWVRKTRQVYLVVCTTVVTACTNTDATHGCSTTVLRYPSFRRVPCILLEEIPGGGGGSLQLRYKLLHTRVDVDIVLSVVLLYVLLYM